MKYTYNITITDPDDDRLTELYVKFGDGTNSTLKPPSSDCCKGWRSGITLMVSHEWKKSGNYSLEAKVRDIRWNWSDWGMLGIRVPKYKPKVENPGFPVLMRMFTLIHDFSFKTRIHYTLFSITAHESKVAVWNKFSGSEHRMGTSYM